MPVRMKIRYEPNPKWILTPSAATYNVTFSHIFFFVCL